MAFVSVSAYDGEMFFGLGCYEKILYDHTLMRRLFDANGVEYDEDLLKEYEECKLMQFEKKLCNLNAGPYGFGVFVMQEGDRKFRGVCHKVDSPWEICELLWFAARGELLEAGIVSEDPFNRLCSDDLQFVTKSTSGNRLLAVVRKLLREYEESSFDVLFEGDCYPHFVASTKELGKEALSLFKNYNASDLPW